MELSLNKVSIVGSNLGLIDEEIEYSSVEELGAIIIGESWAPALFTERKRLIKNLISIDLLVLDVDDGCTLDEAKEKFKDYKHIIATSRSHQKEKNGVICDRFRVVLFLSEPLSSDDDFKATWTRASKLFPFIDPACKDSARFFYPSPGITSINRTGRVFDVSIAPPKPVDSPKLVAPQGAPKGELWKETLKFLLEGAPASHRHTALVKAVGNMREQGYDLTEVIEKVEEMSHRGDWTQPGLNDADLKTINRMFNREMKYGYVPPELGEARPPLIVTASDLINETFEYLSDKDKVKGEPTGIEGLDRLLGGGFRTGELTVLMAQAKTGKNTLYHDLIYRHLERGMPFGYASRELNPATEVIPNLLSIAMGLNTWNADITEDFKRRSIETLSRWSLYFAPGYGSFPADQIEAWFKASREAGVTHFLFDHFHYALDGEDYEATAKLIKRLKSLTKELDIHLSLIVQPRSLREGEQLSLATLRGGAAIGQALDNLLILEREKDPQHKNVSRLTLEVARHKLAKLGKIYLQYNPETTAFIELELEKTKPFLNENAPRNVPRGANGGRWNGGNWPRVSDS
jgi:hypothetical protein